VRRRRKIIIIIIIIIITIIIIIMMIIIIIKYFPRITPQYKVLLSMGSCSLRIKN